MMQGLSALGIGKQTESIWESQWMDAKKWEQRGGVERLEGGTVETIRGTEEQIMRRVVITGKAAQDRNKGVRHMMITD